MAYKLRACAADGAWSDRAAAVLRKGGGVEMETRREGTGLDLHTPVLRPSGA